jgi:hypothetical protein
MNDKAKNAMGLRPSADVRAYAMALVERVGEAEASARTGVSRNSLMRVMAGCGVRAGTIALIERAAASDARPAAA